MNSRVLIASAALSSAVLIAVGLAAAGPAGDPTQEPASCASGAAQQRAGRADSPATPCCATGQDAPPTARKRIAITQWTDEAPRPLANDVCPVSGAAVTADSSTCVHNGFAVRVAHPSLKKEFGSWTTAARDAFIARFAEPVVKHCAVSPACPNPPGASAITYRGNVARVCCPRCLRWWGEADEDARRQIWERNVLGIAAPDESPQIADSPAPGAPDVALVARILDGVSLLVEGMTRERCVHAVEKSLASVEGVDLVGVDLESGVAWIGLEEGAEIESQRLVAAVDDAGFNATLIPRDFVKQALEASQTESFQSSPCAMPQIRPKKAAELRAQD